VPHWVVQVAIAGSLIVWMTYSTTRAYRQADADDRLGRVAQTVRLARADLAVWVLVVGTIAFIIAGN
jgi:hypothetical protein